MYTKYRHLGYLLNQNLLHAVLSNECLEGAFGSESCNVIWAFDENLFWHKQLSAVNCNSFKSLD